MSDFPPSAGGNGNNNNNHRRSSISQAALANLFRAPQFPIGNGSDSQRRRLSITTVGLSASSPVNTASFMRRGSVSTSSESIDENAIEDEEGPLGGSRTTPNTPFARHTSFSSSAPMRGFRAGSSPGNDQYGFNWSEQLRSRAESSVTAARPSFSFPLGSVSTGSSPPRASIHDRSRSVSEMPQPPVQAASVKPKQERPKPDAFQERILKGDFYMD